MIKLGVDVTQPSETTLSGSITIYPATNFTYSIDGKTYQASNTFTGLGVGTYRVTIKDTAGETSAPAFIVIGISDLIAERHYEVKATHLTCPGNNDGAIEVKLAKTYPYTVTLKGIDVDANAIEQFTGTTYSVKSLAAGSYRLCFSIDGLTGYQQCFTVTLTQPPGLSEYDLKTTNNLKDE